MTAQVLSPLSSSLPILADRCRRMSWSGPSGRGVCKASQPPQAMRKRLSSRLRSACSSVVLPMPASPDTMATEPDLRSALAARCNSVFSDSCLSTITPDSRPVFAAQANLLRKIGIEHPRTTHRNLSAERIANEKWVVTLENWVFPRMSEMGACAVMDRQSRQNDTASLREPSL